MTPIFDPLASREYKDAIEYYEAQEDGLGEKFRLAVWSAISILEQYPKIGEEVRHGVRKIQLQRFPYKLIYSVDRNFLYIIAIAHGHREPEYWIERT